MKTSNVIASLLFGAIAAAAPLDKRALVTKTNVVVETVVVYTTVWDGQVATTVATTTSAPAAFYEVTSSRTRRTRSRRPKTRSATASSAVVAPTSVYVPPQVTSIAQASSQAPVSSSVYVAPPAPTTTEQAPVSTTEAPAVSSEAPSSTYVAPPVASSTTADAPAATGGSGEVHSGGSMTMNYYGGGTGACGDPVNDTDMAVALATDVFGTATVDVMTGKTTNKWCNAKVAVTYNGQTTNVVIKDRCAGCTNGGFDFTPTAWEKITGGLGGASGDRITGMTWSLVG